MKKIYIDAGHGGSDPGAVNKGRTEKSDTLRLALKIAEYMKDQDVEIRLSRTSDTDTSINAMCRDANAWGADYFLSIHRNSASPDATGNEIWIYSKANDTTKAKAQKILETVTRVTGMRDRGVKRGAVSYSDYGVNSQTNCHSALLEYGFISNKKDNEIFDKTLDKLGLELTKILLSLVGVDYVEPIIKGDVNGDKKVTTSDAKAVLKAVAGQTKLTDKQKKAADINGDGKVTTADAKAILKKVAGQT